MKLNENVEFSYLNGMNFTFNDGENIITFSVSPFSGKEVVELNADVVSEQKNYSKNSIHTIIHGVKKYEIQLIANNIIKVSDQYRPGSPHFI